MPEASTLEMPVPTPRLLLHHNINVDLTWISLENMDNVEDEDLKLIKASAQMLDDLEQGLGNLLRNANASKTRRVHRHVRKRDLRRMVDCV
jgi:hypothetical protein